MEDVKDILNETITTMIDYLEVTNFMKQVLRKKEPRIAERVIRSIEADGDVSAKSFERYLTTNGVKGVTPGFIRTWG